MPRYWILSMVEENYLVVKERGLIGVSLASRWAIQHMSIGDMLVFYISRKSLVSPQNSPTQKVQQFRGIAKVTGEAFESNEVIWPIEGGKIFPYRRSVEFLSDERAGARPLIEKLSFVMNTLFWAVPLQRGFVEITAKDFETIQDAMEAGREHR